MPNEHIEVVKRWLADNDSVSLKELRTARAAAFDAANAAADAADYAYAVADDAANAAYPDDLWSNPAAFAFAAARSAATAAAFVDYADYAAELTADATRWVIRYDNLTNEK